MVVADKHLQDPNKSNTPKYSQKIVSKVITSF